MDRALTPPEVAKLLGVNPAKVVAWITSGELRASNVAASATGQRPRYRVLPGDLEDFLLQRRPVVHKRPRRRRRRGTTPAVTEYF